MAKSENTYKDREIDRMFGEIKEILIRIETQTTKTNGRVTALEYWREGIMGKFLGASAVIGIVWTIGWELIAKKL